MLILRMRKPVLLEHYLGCRALKTVVLDLDESKLLEGVVHLREWVNFFFKF